MVFDIIQEERKKKWFELGYTLFNTQEYLIDAVYEQMVEYNTTQPYHNIQHLMAVALKSNEILSNTITDTIQYHLLAKNLFIAACFHDVDHSGGKLTDSENIERAVTRLRQFWQRPRTFVGMDLESIIQAIRCTEYPFVKPPYSLNDMCLRDADLLMMLEPDSEYFFVGLAKEMETSFTYEDNIEWLKKQTFFIEYTTVVLKKFFQKGK